MSILENGLRAAGLSPAQRAKALQTLVDGGHVEAANQLVKVEPHAKRLEAAADAMDRDGIGGHPRRGHAAVLRDMASCMRADAAQGKLPHTYEALYGATAGARGVDETIYAAAWEQNSRRMQVMRAEAIGALRRFGIDVSDIEEGGKVSAYTLDQKLIGKPVDQRIRLKALCATAGLLD